MAMLFRTLGSPARLLVPSFALALFGAYHVIWSRPAQIAVAVDHETDLYFGIAERSAAPISALGGKADITIDERMSAIDLKRTLSTDITRLSL